MSPRIRNLLLTTSALLALGTVPGAAGPDGPAVVGGAASVSGAGTSSVIVNQSSSRAIINWSTFNLGTGDTTRFNQPNSSSVVLNRVTGGLGASTIDGTLSANGRVFIINRDGILFGRNATINTASFLATTHDIRNDDFMAGRMNFTIPGRSDASIVNLGRITAESGGFAALVAPGVRNSGTITATLGTVALASGNMFTLDMYGDRLIQLGVNDAIAAQVIDVQTGKPLKSLVSNEGKLKANGGRVELTAVAARAVVDSVINNTGVIEANSVGMRNGKIVLGAATGGAKGAGAPRQTVRVSGRISAAGKKKGTTGGTVLITGEDIQFASAVIDASGRAGGGKVLVGGDWGGGNPDRSLVNNQSAALESYAIDHASTVTMDGATRINASARDSGNGGKVILWSDVQTTFAGVIEARGGVAGGDGGFVEVSSHGMLQYAGMVDTLAPYGATGTLLLDPYNIIIDNSGTGPSGGNFTPSGDDSHLNAGLLAAALGSSNVIVTTGGTGSPGTQDGNITIDAAVNLNWTAATTLTLSAHQDIIFQYGSLIQSSGAGAAGSLVLRADNSGTGRGTVTFLGFGAQANFASSSGAVSLYYNPTGNFDHPVKYDNPTTSFGASVSTSSPSKFNAYMLVNSGSDLQLVGSSTKTLGSTYALGKNIDATSLGAFTPLGTFTGLFDGLGNTISNLNVNGPAPLAINNGTIRNLTLDHFAVGATANNQYLGALVGQNNGTIDNVHIINSTVTAAPGFTGIIAGGLAGLNTSVNSITNSSAATTVTIGNGLSGSGGGWNYAGGLVGINTGTISGSSATGNVTSGANSFAGGLVGQNGNTGQPNSGNTATIQNSWASGTVTSGDSAGGLVGANLFNGARTATITDSQAFGDVAGSGFFATIGGLVGTNGGTIGSTTLPSQTSTCAQGASFSCATGNVSLGQFGDAGGLVGDNGGAISNAFATGNVTAIGEGAIGGLVGNNDGTISNSHARGNVGEGNTTGGEIGGLVGDNHGSVSSSFATGAVIGGSNNFVGGLIGFNDGSIAQSFATGAVNVAAFDANVAEHFSLAGGLVGSNFGLITNSHAIGAVMTGDSGFAGGFVGANGGLISLSYATGSVTGGNGSIVGGFVGFNAGLINQTYAAGATTAGSASTVGGFAGVNATLSALQGDVVGLPGLISQSYALGKATGGSSSITSAFTALNLGALDQVYGAGLVTGGTGSSTGGLVGSNSAALPPPFDLADPVLVFSQGTATNSYWDRQTTGQTTSAGGTGMDTATLAGGLPPGFDPSIWQHGSYPQLTNLGPPQNTTPGPAVLPPQSTDQDTPTEIRNSDSQSIIVNQLSGDLFLRILAIVDPLVIPPPPPPPPLQTQQQPQGQQQLTTGAINPIPGQLDAGPGRFFFVPPPNETRFVSNQVMLQIPANVTLAQLEAVARELGLTIIASQPISLLGVTSYQFQIADGRPVADVIRALVAKQIINGAQPVYTFALVQAPTPADQQEPDLSGQSREGDAAQYILDKLRLAQIHRTVKGTNVKIAVIDSEIDASHPDIKDNIAARYDATGAEDKPHPHGTGMAGAIVSHTRLMGIAPGAQIAAIHAFGSGASAESTTFNILKGLDWAANNGVNIINMSFAGPRDPSLERAIKVAHDKGIVLIAAAGNAGPRSPPLYPAADPNVIAVTATDIDDKLFRGANRGRYIAIAAPGVDILVPAPESAYQMTTGTSVATAHISGIVALLLERNLQLKPEDIRKILAASAKRLGPNAEFGAGLVDPTKALELAAPRSAAVPAPTTGR